MDNVALLEIIRRIKEYAEDVKFEEESDFLSGEKLAFVISLGVIKNTLDSLDMNLQEYGMDIDVDNFY